VPPLIYIALAVLLVLDFISLAPETSGIGFLIVLAGIPVYLVWSRAAAPEPESSS
jgi:APA family basic amino acid/polyamine antiporter